MELCGIINLDCKSLVDFPLDKLDCFVTPTGLAEK